MLRGQLTANLAVASRENLKIADQLEPRLEHVDVVKFPRFRGHPSICVAGVHDGKKERTLHAGVSASDD